MTAPARWPGPQRLAPTSDISARMPPSPWLSARITNRQYFTETVTSSVQKISDSTPSAAPWSTCGPVACSTVCRV